MCLTTLGKVQSFGIKIEGGYNIKMKRKKKQTFFKPSVPPKITNLNWKQAKARFPGLKPYGDIDRDGVKNFRDCKPFDIKRQGEGHKSIKRTLKGYTEEWIERATQDDEKEPTKEELEALKHDAKFTFDHNKETQGDGVWH